MKSILLRYLLCFILALSTFAKLEAQSVSPTKKAQPATFTVTAKVDQRVELMSIIARLAGYGEYVNNSFKLYANDVDSYFEKYKQHPAVQFAIKIRESNGIGFDAVMTMAVHLNPPPSLTPRVAFHD